jgi:CBS-domain-containing membrane protein
MDALNALKRLRDMTIADVWPTRPIVWVSNVCNLEEALKLLKLNKILSLPVVDVPRNTCIGTVDVMDITLYVVACFPSIDSITYDVLKNLDWNGRKFLADTTVSQVMAFSKAWNYSDLPNYPVKLSTSVVQLLEIFSFGIHRLPVLSDDNSKVINFISQADLLRFFTENIYLLEERGIGKKTLDELGIGRSSVYFVRSDAMTLLTLSVISSKKISAIPVLDKETGKLVATFSASDLKGLGPGDLPHLLQPLVQFITTHNLKSMYPLTCKVTDTFESVICKLGATKVHRLWVVNDFHQLLGVVSLTDVMYPFLGIEPMPAESTNMPAIVPSGLYIGGTPRYSPNVIRVL